MALRNGVSFVLASFGVLVMAAAEENSFLEVSLDKSFNSLVLPDDLYEAPDRDGGSLILLSWQTPKKYKVKNSTAASCAFTSL